jgi:hypothetical protein
MPKPRPVKNVPEPNSLSPFGSECVWLAWANRVHSVIGLPVG